MKETSSVYSWLCIFKFLCHLSMVLKERNPRNISLVKMCATKHIHSTDKFLPLKNEC